MVFSSLTFLYFLLPVTLVLYFLIPNRVWRNAVLLAASLLFYAWGEPRIVVLMVAATLVAWFSGLGMDAARRQCRHGLQKALCIGAVVLITSNLFIYKYLGFLTDILEQLLGFESSLPALALPIGISFYTFQILSYVIDLYRGKVACQRNFFHLLLYVAFFPQLVAGPIVRYETIEAEILHRREHIDDVYAGLQRLIIGLAKKVIIANNVAIVAETVYAGDPAVYGGAMYWLAAVAYTLQIYFDFSGYSDMAIGLGRIFGFHFLENFDHPYVSRSVTEFWRRWHISLSSWFRDYIYIPLGGNRVSRAKWFRNILIVWGLTGLWHGAAWNFILWGLYYGVLLLIEKLWLQKLLDRAPKWIGWLYTMLIVVVGWVLFNLTDFAALGEALRIMFTLPRTNWVGVISADASILFYSLFILLGAICAFPLRQHIKPPQNELLTALLSAVFHGVLLLICVIIITTSKYNPFIYFRF